MGSTLGKEASRKAKVTRIPKVPEFRLKVVFVGNPFSGRSSVFERYVNNRFDYETYGSPHTVRTGTKVWLISEPTGGLAYLNVWDTPRYVDLQAEGEALWGGAGVIFVCVDGKDIREIEPQILKWCQDPSLLKAQGTCGSIICVLITKTDALRKQQEEDVKTLMGRLLQYPDLALDTWCFCSAKTGRGLQGPEDPIKLLLYQYVKDDYKRQRKQGGKSRRSIIHLLEELDTPRASIASLANKINTGSDTHTAAKINVKRASTPIASRNIQNSEFKGSRLSVAAANAAFRTSMLDTLSKNFVSNFDSKKDSSASYVDSANESVSHCQDYTMKEETWTGNSPDRVAYVSLEQEYLKNDGISENQVQDVGVLITDGSRGSLRRLVTSGSFEEMRRSQSEEEASAISDCGRHEVQV